MLKLYKKLFKIQNFIVIQLQLNKTELTVFLHKKMLNFLSFNYFCEQNRKTLKHVMIHCIKHSEMHEKLKIKK